MLLDASLNDFENYGPIPADKYEWIIRKMPEVVINPNEKTDINTTMFSLLFYPEVSTGEMKGKECRVSFMNKTKGNRYFLKSFLEKIGVPVSSNGSFDSNDMLGKQFTAAIVITEGKGTNAGKKYSNMDTESAVAIS
jgi:hypothetical protein